MNCEKCQDLLSEYLDGTLGHTAHAAVGAHIAGCAACAAAREDFHAIIAVAREARGQLFAPTDERALWLRVRNLLRLKCAGDLVKNYGVVLEEQVASRTADLQEFRSAMDFTADIVTLVHRDTMRFTEVNAAACALWGLTRAELLEIGPADLGFETRASLAPQDEV
jgi:PAS domain-containing protein